MTNNELRDSIAKEIFIGITLDRKIFDSLPKDLSPMGAAFLGADSFMAARSTARNWDTVKNAESSNGIGSRSFIGAPETP